jgi:hypothetical protein
MGKGNIPPDIPGFSIPFQPNRAILNGTTDFGQVQDAINEASAGDTIMVGPGTYEENITVDVDDISIIGTETGTVLHGGDSTAMTVESNDVTLSSFAVKSNPGGSGDGLKFLPQTGTISDPQVTSVDVLDAGRDGIRVNNCFGTRLSDINIEKCSQDAIMFKSGRRGSVSNVYLGENPDSIQRGFVSEGPSRITLGNFVVFKPAEDGVLIQGDDCVVSDGVVIDAGQDGVDIDGTDDIVDGMRIFGSVDSDLDTSDATTPTLGDNNLG